MRELQDNMHGSILLDAVRVFIERFCVFPSVAGLDAVTLWAAHAHMVQHFHTTPRLALLSPESGSGKTRVLEILDLLVPNSMSVVTPRVATIFRKLNKEQITLLVDECDAIFMKIGGNPQNEELRALLNAGYKRGAVIPRCVGSNHDVHDFPVFAATALAGLGSLPRTVMTRAVVIRMTKRSSSERVESFRLRVHEAEAHVLRQLLAAWADDVGQRAGADWPRLPAGIEDRRAEVWEPLIAVADQAGGRWPEAARSACVELAAAADTENSSLGVQLLADLRLIFGDEIALPTTLILERLRGEKPYRADGKGEPLMIADDAPWSELRGRPLDFRSLAKMLRRYGVVVTKVKFNGRSLRGYRQEDLWDAWNRYLPAQPGGTEPAEPEEPTGFREQRQAVQDETAVPHQSRVPEPDHQTEPSNPTSGNESSVGSAGSAFPTQATDEGIQEVEI